MRTKGSIGLGVCLLFVALSTRGAAAPRAKASPPVLEPPCAVPQSPRNVDPAAQPTPYLCTAGGSRMRISPDQSYVDLQVRPEPGCITRLVYCGQHYHAPVENVQGCPGETDLLPPDGRTPRVGQWVEVHTLYAPAAKPSGTCDPEGLNCCVGHPILVLGFSAKVVDRKTPARKANRATPPILNPTSGALAEWSGSNTGGDAFACKPIAATWSFRLAYRNPNGSCNPNIVARTLLEQAFPGGVQAARGLQGGDRVSKDLVRVP
jgi:hypothetical protein